MGVAVGCPSAGLAAWTDPREVPASIEVASATARRFFISGRPVETGRKAIFSFTPEKRKCVQF